MTTATVNVYAVDESHDLTRVTVEAHKDLHGVYLSIRGDKGTPIYGLDLTEEEAVALVREIQAYVGVKV